jgi:hypothetical protein
MELMFVIIIAVAVGLGIRYLLPGRDTYGVALIPAVDGAVTAILWVALVWAGWKFDGGWIWAVTLIAGGLVALAVALAIPRGRRTADANLLQSLSRA